MRRWREGREQALGDEGGRDQVGGKMPRGQHRCRRRADGGHTHPGQGPDIGDDVEQRGGTVGRGDDDPVVGSHLLQGGGQPRPTIERRIDGDGGHLDDLRAPAS